VIVDSSALVAVVFREPEADAIITKLSSTDRAGIGTPTLAETGIVLSARLGTDPQPLLIRLLDEFSILEVPFAPSHWREAILAFRRFGRGQHPAGLNFGDCLAYATARLADEPLLYVGTDFAATDLETA
jgi:ribonuclease VapC